MAVGNGSQPRMPVSVFDGAHFVETRTCVPEPTPDGRPGVLYRGLVHPLLEGERIDLSGPAFVPGDGGGARPAGPAPARTRRAVVRGDSSGYVLVEGSVADRESAAAAIREAGASVARAGRYLGAALGDLAPDWFVRFDLNGAPFEAVETAVGAVKQVSEGSAESAAELRVRLLAAELAQARARIAALEADNARLRVERAEASAAAAAADADALARLEAERAALQDALVAESRARVVAEALAGETTTVAPRPEAPRGLTAEIETVLRVVTPRVRLVRDSLSFAAVELRDRGALYRALAQLEAADAGWPPGWKKLQAANGWWERHLSDGSSDAGRLYARLDPSDRSVDVLVSTKGEQARDIAWLRRG